MGALPGGTDIRQVGADRTYLWESREGTGGRLGAVSELAVVALVIAGVAVYAAHSALESS